MAYCPQCQFFIDPQLITSRTLECPQCRTLLQFNLREYKIMARPGIYIVMLFLLNIFFTEDTLFRLGLNIAIVMVWFAFYLRFKNYLKNVKLEQQRIL